MIVKSVSSSPRKTSSRPASQRSSENRSSVKNSGNRGGARTHPAFTALLVAGGFIGLVAVMALLGWLPMLVLYTYAGASLALFALYFIDKHSAQNGSRRTPEATLHNLALLGGWPGALIAQQLFRHKTSKASFRRVFWATVVLNIAALGYVVSPYGQQIRAMIAS